MSTPEPTPPTSATGATANAVPPPVSLSTLSTILHDPGRWKIIRELAKGDPLPVSEITRRVRKTRDIVQRNMGVLKDAKIAVQTYGRLYRLAPEFPVSAGGTRVDFGFCILCLDRLPV